MRHRAGAQAATPGGQGGRGADGRPGVAAVDGQHQGEGEHQEFPLVRGGAGHQVPLPHGGALCRGLSEGKGGSE